MRTSYRERDYTFGQIMLTLRTEMNLTQEGLSNLLGVSRRAVGEWEAGNSYPKAEHLKELITLAVKSQAFCEGSIAQEIRALWKAARQKVLIDESWLSSFLEHPYSPHIHLVPKTVEEGMDSALVGRQEPDTVPTAPLPRVDWADASIVPIFYGREEELALLSQWIVQEHSSVVSLLGMGGIGKSTLAVKLMYQLAVETGQAQRTGQAQGTVPTMAGCPFEVVIFRSLHDAPSCEALLTECLQVFSPQPPDEVPAGQTQDTVSTEQSLSLLLEHLRQVRTLLVLDNLECLLEDKDVKGHFRPGFEGYGSLLHRIAETTHQSCLLLTSREKPADLRVLECKHSVVHSLRLAGLDAAACQHLIEDKGVVGSPQERAQLIEVYSGNPLALKIVAEIIVELFAGEIGPFLASESPVIFGSITDLLDEQFARLTTLEQTILCWLAIMREPVTFDELLMLLAYPPLRVQVLEAVDNLRQRSLIECGKRPGSFTLQAVMLEYVTATFIAKVSSEIQQHRLDWLIQHSLSPSLGSKYIRQAQERLLLSPLLARLQNIYQQLAEMEVQLLSLLEELRGWTSYAQGYGPANLITLLGLLRGHLKGFNLSHLSIRGTYLQDIEMHDVSPFGV